MAQGDRVGIYMENSCESVVAMLAASRGGAAFGNLSPMLRPAQADYITQDCAIRVLIADSSKVEGIELGGVERVF